MVFGVVLSVPFCTTRKNHQINMFTFQWIDRSSQLCLKLIAFRTSCPKVYFILAHSSEPTIIIKRYKL